MDQFAKFKHANISNFTVFVLVYPLAGSIISDVLWSFFEEVEGRLKWNTQHLGQDAPPPSPVLIQENTKKVDKNILIRE